MISARYRTLAIALVLMFVATASLEAADLRPDSFYDGPVFAYAALVAIGIMVTMLAYTRRWTTLGSGLLVLAFSIAMLRGAPVLFYYHLIPTTPGVIGLVANIDRVAVAIGSTFILIGLILDTLERRREQRAMLFGEVDDPA